MTRFRIVEIGAALLLTLAALMVFGLKVWADPLPPQNRPALLEARLVAMVPQRGQ